MIARRTLLAAAGIGALSRPRRARAAEFELKWAHAMPSTHPINIRALEAAQRILKETDGKIDIQLFPDSQLGSDNDMASQARSGSLEIYTAACSSIGPLVPAATIVNLPFAFHTASDGWKALDGDLGTYVADAFPKVGLFAFHEMWASGFREITSYSKPIKVPTDLNGFKIRVPNSPLLLRLFRSLGASPVTVDISEAYTALQTHLVDGQENPLAIIATRNFNEVQKYCAMTNHVWDVFIQTINADTWKSIPAPLQAIVTKNLASSALQQRQDVETSSSSLQKQLEGKGMVFVDPDSQSFRAALQKAGSYEAWKKEFGDQAWAIVEKYTGPLA